ncbi:MAG: hypothetical protein HYX25_01745 [Candidatus Solibacter usitatus]|nr:hypothetical protein [Candidatus Solibacter usitatus]
MRRTWLLLLLSPILLQPQQQKNDDLSTRQMENQAAMQQGKSGKREIASDGQWRMSQIVKAQYDQLAADTEKLHQLSGELKTELANPNVLSVGALRKSEEIEKLAKKVHSRLKGWF